MKRCARRERVHRVNPVGNQRKQAFDNNIFVTFLAALPLRTDFVFTRSKFALRCIHNSGTIGCHECGQTGERPKHFARQLQKAVHGFGGDRSADR